MTHTYAVLEVSRKTYEEIEKKLRDSGYEHAFHLIDTNTQPHMDMQGLALALERDTHNSDPLHERPDGWYFYDETWANACGPYRTRELADVACTMYAWAELEHGPLDEMMKKLKELGPKWV